MILFNLMVRLICLRHNARGPLSRGHLSRMRISPQSPLRRKPNVLWVVAGVVFVLVLGVVSSHGQMSGRFGLDIVARRIPTTLTGEIKLDTPSEFVMLEFAIASRLVLTVSLGFADLNVDAAVNTAGPEHYIFKGSAAWGEVDIYGLILEGFSVVPEMWFAVPFETVLDVNNLPNSVLIPPADTLFVRSAVTTTATLAGFTIKHLLMFEDVNFPNPGSSYAPLYYPCQSPSLKPQYALGSLTTISWRAACGISISSVSGINAVQAGKSVKGYSASGRVLPGNWFENISVGGISLGDIPCAGVMLYDAYVGVGATVSVTQTLSGTVSFSARLSETMSLGSSVTLFRLPAQWGGMSVSMSFGPFRMSVRLDQLEITSLSAGFGSSLNLGAVTGTYGISASGLERGMTGLSMRLAIAQGMFSGNTSISFAQSAASFSFASLSTSIALRLSPGVIAFQATFGRFGLTRASVSTGVVF
jgi:hypothetical protein